ncbi:MAG: formyltransferase family protein [Bacteroidia bacterium]
MIKKVILIGGGSVALNIAKYLKLKSIELHYLENKSDFALSNEEMCRTLNISFSCLSKDEITEYFLKQNEKTLVISASNRYLFPADVIAKSNLEIINFHGSLLPDYPGRNAEAWTIFDLSKYAGITWHSVVDKVDKGDILIQKKFKLSEKHTSFSLLRANLKLAYDSFLEIENQLFSGTYKLYKQGKGKNTKFNFAKDIPNNGYLDFNWTGDKISAFLRAMDYGPLKILGAPKISFNDLDYTIEKYSITNEVKNSNEKIILDGDILFITKPQKKITLKICRIHER